MNQSSEQSPRRKAAATATKTARKSSERARGMAADRVKATIVMSGNVDFRLSSVAASVGMDRSALAAQLIDQGLRAYKLDAVLRQFSDRQDSSVNVSQADATAA